MYSKAHVMVGRIVQKHRLDKNIRQLDLASMLGIKTSQFISNIERGVSKIPFETLGQLCSILGLPEEKIVNLLVKDFKRELQEDIQNGKKAKFQKVSKRKVVYEYEFKRVV